MNGKPPHEPPDIHLNRPPDILGKAPNAVNHSHSASAKGSHCDTINQILVSSSSLDLNTHAYISLLNITPIHYQIKGRVTPKHPAWPVPKTQYSIVKKKPLQLQIPTKIFPRIQTPPPQHMPSQNKAC